MPTSLRTISLPVVSLLLLSSCTKGGEPASGSGQAARTLAVRTAPVAARDVVYTVQALGSLEPEELVQITAEVSGAVKEVLLPRRRPGDAGHGPGPHRPGALPPRGGARRGDLSQGGRRLEARRGRPGAARGARARSSWSPSRSSTASARRPSGSRPTRRPPRRRSRSPSRTQRRADVRPSRAGEINTRTVDTGQFVQVGNVLATLVDLRRLRLRFKVSESESLKAADGQTVTFRVAAARRRRVHRQGLPRRRRRRPRHPPGRDPRLGGQPRRPSSPASSPR